MGADNDGSPDRLEPAPGPDPVLLERVYRETGLERAGLLVEHGRGAFGPDDDEWEPADGTGGQAILGGDEVVAARPPAALERSMDQMREAALRRGHRFAVDALADEAGLGPLERDVVWVLLYAVARGDGVLSAPDLHAALPLSLDESLELGAALLESSPLLERGLVELDSEDPGEDRMFRLSPAALAACLGKAPAPGSPSPDGTGVTEPPPACADHHELLDLVLRLCEARLAEADPFAEDCSEPSSLRARLSIRRRALAMARGRVAPAPTAPEAELEALLRAELASGRWADSPLGRLARAHGLSEQEQQLLVFLAFDGEGGGDDDFRIRPPWAPPREDGTKGTRALAALATGRAARMRLRRLLYERATLRRTGLVVATNADEDVPERLGFTVPEAVLRQLLGDEGEGDAPLPAGPGRARVSGAIRRTRPTVRLADVVLPETVRRRIEVDLGALADRSPLELGDLAGRLRGHAFVLTGPPGTGKTLCAEAIAGELGADLLSVEVPALTSKWVGETQKNIARVFQQARGARGRAVLLFDEADSLFYDRGDAVRSWEVQDVNVLLTEIERHPGVVVLTTNRRDALDVALSRRVSTVIDFPMPDAAARVAIWLRHLPAAEHLAPDLDVAELAAAVTLSGGEIAQAVRLAARNARHAGVPRLDRTVLLEAARTVLESRWGQAAHRPMGFGAPR